MGVSLELHSVPILQQQRDCDQQILKMKIHIFLFCLAMLGVVGSPGGRQRRDLTCASLGHRSCQWSCKLRGRATGECVWNMTTAAYNCECSEERRGLRCNVG